MHQQTSSQPGTYPAAPSLYDEAVRECGKDRTGTRLAAFREDGTEVLPGEPIKDHRGDPAVFVEATRAPDNGRTGKITFYTRFWTAADARRLNWVTAGQPNTAECYMTVFDLTVREVPQ